MTTLQAWGLACGSLAGVLALLKALTAFAPFRWLWRRLVHDPVQEGLRTVIVAEVKPMLDGLRAELVPNGGSSLRDAIDRTEREVCAVRKDVGDVAARVTALEYKD